MNEIPEEVDAIPVGVWRDDACLKMKVPWSGNPALDAIIREGRRLDFMEKAWCAFNDDPTTKDGSHPSTDPAFVGHIAQLTREWAYGQCPMYQ